jgi:outer membrane immunogenic protein
MHGIMRTIRREAMKKTSASLRHPGSTIPFAVVIIGQIGLAGGPAIAATPSGEDPSVRVDTLEREVAALRKENRSLRAQQHRGAPDTAVPGKPARAASNPANAYAAVPAVTRTMMPPAGASWTGFYIGANAGLSVGRSPTTRSSFFSTNSAEINSDTFQLSPFGAVGGGQIGYNWQAMPNWLLGLEADIQGSSEKETVCIYQCANPVVAGFTRNMTVTQRLDWFGTARGRVGWTNGPVLFYGTGGLAFGQVGTDISLADFNFGQPINQSAHTVQTKTGWTAGAGVEAQLSGNWTAKVEYLYVDLGQVGTSDFNVLFTPALTPAIGEPQHFTSSFRDHIVRAGLNYKFGDPVYTAATSDGGGMYRKAPPVQLAVYNWTGLYVGANVGAGVARNQTSTPLSLINNTAGTAQNNFDAEQFTLSPLGAIGGGQIGYNWQVTPNWVFGIETDFQGSGQKDTVCLGCIFISAGGQSGQLGTVLTQRIDWFGTARGRLGWTSGPALFYATGGLAYGHISTDETVNTIPFLTGVSTAARFNETRLGWTAGGGIEAHLFGNWTAKAEYLYMDLGDVSGSVTAPQTVIPLNVNPNNVNISETRGFSSAVHDHILRVGVNYKFDPNSIVARY